LQAAKVAKKDVLKALDDLEASEANEAVDQDEAEEGEAGDEAEAEDKENEELASEEEVVALFENVNFRQKIGVFLKNQCYDPNFAKSSSILNKNGNFLHQIFRRKYLKNHNMGPWMGWGANEDYFYLFSHLSSAAAPL
jgi:leucyl aminopeptidase